MAGKGTFASGTWKAGTWASGTFAGLGKTPSGASAPRVVTVRGSYQPGRVVRGSYQSGRVVRGSYGPTRVIRGSLMSLTQNLTMFLGEYVRFNGTWDSIPAGGISGWTITVQVRALNGPSPGVILTKTATIVDTTNAIYYWEFFTADTSGLDPTLSYTYSVWRTDLPTQEGPLVSGTLDLETSARYVT